MRRSIDGEKLHNYLDCGKCETKSSVTKSLPDPKIEIETGIEFSGKNQSENIKCEVTFICLIANNHNLQTKTADEVRGCRMEGGLVAGVLACW